MSFLRSNPPSAGCRPGFNFLHANTFHPLPTSSPSDMARMSFLSHCNTKSGEYTEELWQACAGPLVSVPKVGQRVWYFPQGHMEQVAASTGQPQGADQQIPQFNLPSQILCRVMSRSLSAEADSDEVFAQLSLVPEAEGADLSDEDKEESTPPPAQAVRLFTKILTASDTSTHGGFSVLRKHAEECLPPLDTSQENPSQELVATDLHGQEWKFRHTYRGHPRRHLLTTGWSYFVSQKKLVAGDAVVFLRGENGELRVGIRRTKRQQSSQPSNVLTSDCMHMGVIATAFHAVQTRTMFSVFYRPRASPSPFIVPVEKLTASLSKNLCVGMRFKMRFEGEDATERSYSGTVTGIEDRNPACWPHSKWRSLRVNWDEMTHHEQRERVSPWEIELCVHSQAAPSNLSPGPKSKRVRSASTLDLGSNSKMATMESSLASMPTVPPGPVNGHELKAGASAPVHLLSAGISQHSQHHWGRQCEQQGDFRAPAVEGVNMFQPQMAPLQGRWLAGGHGDTGHQRPYPPLHPDYLQQHHGLGVDARSFFPMPAGGGVDDHLTDHIAAQHAQNSISSNIMHFKPGVSWQPPSFSSATSSRPIELSSFNPLGTLGSPSVNGPSQTEVDNPPVALLQHQALGCSPLSPFAPWDSLKQEKQVDHGCKLFGFSLTELPSPPKAAKLGLSFMDEQHNEGKADATFQAPILPSQENEIPQQSNVPDKSVSSEPEISNSTCGKVSKEGDSRGFSNAPPPIRSCTKVINKGSMVGRGVDLSKFDSYEKLIEELEAVFHIEGELSDPAKGWQVAYSDDEGDMMHVGDDPWMEFCCMVRKIYIFSPEEVQANGLSHTRSHLEDPLQKSQGDFSSFERDLISMVGSALSTCGA